MLRRQERLSRNSTRQARVRLQTAEQEMCSPTWRPDEDDFQRARLPDDPLLAIFQRCPFGAVVMLNRRYRDLLMSVVHSATATVGADVNSIVPLLRRAPLLRHMDLHQSTTAANIIALAALPQVRTVQRVSKPFGNSEVPLSKSTIPLEKSSR